MTREQEGARGGVGGREVSGGRKELGDQSREAKAEIWGS